MQDIKEFLINKVQGILRKYLFELMDKDTVVNFQIEMMVELKPYLVAHEKDLSWPCYCSVGDNFRLVIDTPTTSRVETLVEGTKDQWRTI